MSEIVWQDPPASGTRGKHDALKAELKANPGRWALVGRYSHAASLGTRWKGQGYEAVTRRTEGMAADLYVRWPEVAVNADAEPGRDGAA